MCHICISSFCIISFSSVQGSDRTCHRSIQTSNSSCTLLGGGLLVSYCSQHVERHSFLVSHHKGSYKGCFSRLGAEGTAITAINPLVTHRHVLYRQWSSSSVFQAVVGHRKHLQQRFTSNVGQNGQICMLWRSNQTMPHLFRVELA